MLLGITAYAIGTGLTAHWCHQRGWGPEDWFLVPLWPLIPLAGFIGWSLIFADWAAR